jgi:NAD(P)-dependent dehydrogenase (short-subunit alcohol dehydrogenase family)
MKMKCVLITQVDFITEIFGIMNTSVASLLVPKRPLTWLITGCSGGFGLALARLAQVQGHRVIATSRNPAKTPDLVAEIESKDGKWIKLDVDDLESAKLVETLESEGIALDVLVNNAGWTLHGPVEGFTESEVRRIMETHYFGPYRLIRATVPHMRRRRAGIIVNISSAAGLNARESMGIYGPAKAALDSKFTTLHRAAQ